MAERGGRYNPGVDAFGVPLEQIQKGVFRWVVFVVFFVGGGGGGGGAGRRGSFSTVRVRGYLSWVRFRGAGGSGSPGSGAGALALGPGFASHDIS